MGDRVQRLKGKANEGAGNAKQTVGYRSGKPKTELEGAAQTAKGKTQHAVGKARSTVKKKTR